MQFNLYIFNQLFRTCMALITVLISIIWLFQSIRLLEFVVDKGASVGNSLRCRSRPCRYG